MTQQPWTPQGSEDYRRVFLLCWKRYRKELIRGETLPGTQTAPSRNSPKGMFDRPGMRYRIDFENAGRAAIRLALPDEQRLRSIVFESWHLQGCSRKWTAAEMGVSERHFKRVRREVEELVGIQLWLRGFCRQVEGARDSDLAIAYFVHSERLEQRA